MIVKEKELTNVRDRLLDSAEAVVVREGVAHLTLDAVAREAGVSKGGLLYHFPNKAALITGIVERLASQCEAEQQLSLSDNDAQAPGAFLRAYLSTRSKPFDPKEKPIHTALLAAAGSHPDYVEPMRQRWLRWQAKVENDGIDPATATIIRLAVDGLCLGTMLGIPGPSSELRNEVFQKLLGMTHPNGPQAKQNNNKE